MSDLPRRIEDALTYEVERRNIQPGTVILYKDSFFDYVYNGECAYTPMDNFGALTEALYTVWVCDIRELLSSDLSYTVCAACSEPIYKCAAFKTVLTEPSARTRISGSAR